MDILGLFLIIISGILIFIHQVRNLVPADYINILLIYCGLMSMAIGTLLMVIK